MRVQLNNIKKKSYTANTIQYNSKSHDLSETMLIERRVPNDSARLLEREEMWIQWLESKQPHGQKGLKLNSHMD